MRRLFHPVISGNAPARTKLVRAADPADVQPARDARPVRRSRSRASG